MRLNELQPGDKVVIEDGFDHLSTGEVTKVTKTQITVRGDNGIDTRYNRNDGVKIGDANEWRKQRIVQKGWGEILTVGEAAELITAQQEKRERRVMIDKIKNTQSTIYHRMTIDELKAIVAMIDAAKINQD